MGRATRVPCVYLCDESDKNARLFPKRILTNCRQQNWLEEEKVSHKHTKGHTRVAVESDISDRKALRFAFR